MKKKSTTEMEMANKDRDMNDDANMTTNKMPRGGIIFCLRIMTYE